MRPPARNGPPPVAHKGRHRLDATIQTLPRDTTRTNAPRRRSVRTSWMGNDGTGRNVWRFPGRPSLYNNSGRMASPWYYVHPDNLRQTSLPQQNLTGSGNTPPPSTKAVSASSDASADKDGSESDEDERKKGELLTPSPDPARREIPLSEGAEDWFYNQRESWFPKGQHNSPGDGQGPSQRH
jgi:hypothetical protein